MQTQDQRRAFDLYRLVVDKVFEVSYVPGYVLGDHNLVQKPIELV
ncbi:hypothetical protein FOXG_22572 [Fusarium oxysporum f. sp. lycopersici 4287]|uniref:Uncharacterized protein n=1 Tax=Fusarium oxysporum f. sp. lycopersici (strain 4287 / CBS 123668 / FGSC 9935 / NRRL 34936) TaxID=426428 RepID=A0A0J9WAD3_FUSO4|nr:hypothetical protein FOXG_22545 [Fusarium oxysporum f. sp. lycopersici 4287]XP_018257506.1 hypothetical protein FOXG_22572 [Fusarium oxysporum f. sp. lycopersici 4287]KNB19378.1 hypothetical protein FOXG_22545 [Fusarium oxysporum f. sp. lycopersici 4287]KNB19461.1 hypothetical protein FOXG_22572 [Fusarium oxysporum f. sp. lycopersici 4287]